MPTYEFKNSEITHLLETTKKLNERQFVDKLEMIRQLVRRANELIGTRTASELGLTLELIVSVETLLQKHRSDSAVTTRSASGSLPEKSKRFIPEPPKRTDKVPAAGSSAAAPPPLTKKKRNQSAAAGSSAAAASGKKRKRPAASTPESEGLRPATREDDIDNIHRRFLETGIHLLAREPDAFYHAMRQLDMRRSESMYAAAASSAGAGLTAELAAAAVQSEPTPVPVGGCSRGSSQKGATPSLGGVSIDGVSLTGLSLTGLGSFSFLAAADAPEPPPLAAQVAAAAAPGALDAAPAADAPIAAVDAADANAPQPTPVGAVSGVPSWGSWAAKELAGMIPGFGAEAELSEEGGGGPSMRGGK